MSKEPTNLSLTLLQRLQAGRLKPEQWADAERLFRQSVGWQKWLQRFAGALGLLFLLAGIMFFYAANWSKISPQFRLISLQGAISIAALVAIFLPKIRGYLLIAASFLTGVLLAVFGQVYQTGADAFEVYALWAGLILPWVLIAKSIGLWALWLAVLQVAISLLGGQYLVPSGWPWEWIIAILALINFLAVAIFEFLVRKYRSLENFWFRNVLIAIGFTLLTMLPFRWIFEMNHLSNASASIAAMLWLLVAVFGFFYFYQLRPNTTGLGLVLLSITTVLVCAVARFIFDARIDGLGAWFLMAIVSLGAFGGAATLLIGIHKSIAARTKLNQQEDESV